MEEELRNRIQEKKLGDLVSPMNQPTYVDVYSNSKARIVIKVPAEKSHLIKLGDFTILYEYKRELFMVGKVTGELTYDIDTESFIRSILTSHPQKPDAFELVEGKHIDNYGTPHHFQVEPVARISVDDNGYFKVRPDFSPSVPTTAMLPEFKEIETVFNLKRDEYKLAFGVMMAKDKLYTLNDRPFLIGLTEYEFRRHIVLFGRTGMGKTQIVKGSAHYLFRQGASLLITDSQGDMAGMLWESVLHPDQKNFFNEEIDQTIWNEMGYSQIGIPKEHITILYPPGYMSPKTNAILHHAQKNGVEVRNLHIKSSIITSVEQLSIALEDLSDAQYESLATMFHIFMKKNKNVFDLQKFIGDVSSADSNTIKLATKSVLLRKLNLLLNKHVFADDSVTETKYRDLISKNHVTILLLQGIPKEIQSFYELLVFSMITDDRHRIDTEVEDRVIIIDEASDIIPKVSSGSEVTKALYKAFDKIASQGRKFKITLIIASQRPSSIHPGVVSQASTKLFLSLDSDDVDSVHRYLGEYKEDILSFPPMKAIMHSSGRPLLEVRFPVPPVYHCDPVEIFKLYPDIANEPQEDEQQQDFDSLLDGKTSEAKKSNQESDTTENGSDWE